MEKSHLEKGKENQKIKYANNIYFQLEQKIQSRINSFFKEQKYKATDLLGCSISHLKNWLEFQLKPGEKLEDMDLDHVLPISEIRDKNNAEEVYKYFNWSNLAPTNPSENKSRKSRRDKSLEEEHEKYLSAFFEANFN